MSGIGTLSCAKKSTSYQLFPFESIQEIISITFKSDIVNFLNFSGEPIVNVEVFVFH